MFPIVSPVPTTHRRLNRNTFKPQPRTEPFDRPALAERAPFVPYDAERDLSELTREDLQPGIDAYQVMLMSRYPGTIWFDAPDNAKAPDKRTPRTPDS